MNAPRAIRLGAYPDRYPFSDSQWSYSTFEVVPFPKRSTIANAVELFLYGGAGGGHSASALSTVPRFSVTFTSAEYADLLDGKPTTHQWEACYDPPPYELMKSFEEAAVHVPGETWIDKDGEVVVGRTAQGKPVRGARGKIYRSKQWFDAKGVRHLHAPPSNIWDIEGYVPTPGTRHNYTWLKWSTAANLLYLLSGNNGSNLPQPLGSLTLGGNRAAFDPYIVVPERRDRLGKIVERGSRGTWIDCGSEQYGGATAEDPRNGLFYQISKDGIWRVFDPRTNALVRPSIAVRSQRYFTTPYASFTKIDENLCFDYAAGNRLVFFNRQSPQRIFAVSVDLGTLLPSFTELEQRTAAGCPMPTTDTMHSRRWAQLPDGRFVGGVRGGDVWTCKVADRWLEWDRRPLASLGRDGRKVGPSHFGSCFANVTVGWNQFALIYPYNAPGIELYLIAWDVEAFGRRGQSRS